MATPPTAPGQPPIPANAVLTRPIQASTMLTRLALTRPMVTGPVLTRTVPTSIPDHLPEIEDNGEPA
jgi:hypothetical protein